MEKKKSYCLISATHTFMFLTEIFNECLCVPGTLQVTGDRVLVDGHNSCPSVASILGRGMVSSQISRWGVFLRPGVILKKKQAGRRDTRRCSCGGQWAPVWADAALLEPTAFHSRPDVSSAPENTLSSMHLSALSFLSPLLLPDSAVGLPVSPYLTDSKYPTQSFH